MLFCLVRGTDWEHARRHRTRYRSTAMKAGADDLRRTVCAGERP